MDCNKGLLIAANLNEIAKKRNSFDGLSVI
jgi:hypothetical protein